MPLPASLQLVTVQNTYTLPPSGTPAQGFLTFEPKGTTTLQDPVSNTTVVLQAYEVAIGPTGFVSVQLPPTNNPAWVPINGTYHVTENFKSGIGRQYDIYVPYTATVVELSDVAIDVLPPQPYANFVLQTTFDTYLAASGSAPLTYTQTTPAATWTIAHGLGRPPVTVTILDTSGIQVEADIDYDNVGQIVVTFGSPFAGSAIYF